ncbi:FabD/lysophospholipase-like protein [Microthyrium microscopicum]|uniref:FabD/lysophospholipase-like protein n=1 Tax=Microthyrium microscopicum TaxID=703497 RepID=A0A6A6UH64_9PEZI|nr:FabD/lysophospholipase-like protein [Microthyrium microscopicum]
MASSLSIIDSHGVRRKDTTKGPPLRILSLDGGGIRGYSMLIILQEIMHRTFVEMEGRAPKRHEIPKPCDHFDLIVGTGTGGLIALMLGRMRLTVEQCKDVYVRMTKKVFETDKTIAGIPYRSTLFKASRLEDAIRECVREHTVYASEGNDEDDAEEPESPSTPTSSHPGRPTRSLSVTSRYSQIGTGPTHTDLRNSFRSSRWGNPNAHLYDNRANRTKTAVTAVYKGTKRGAPPALLRSYDSRKETAAEERCMIWQAGRATCATQLAFKPIQVGQSVFLDEGVGKYNPSPLALDEAVLNEWPGRDVGVFVSIGTGKRPGGTSAQQHLWWEGFVSSGLSDFAEARRRLISKIEGCEDTHQEMIHGRLADRGVNVENYYRLNVEVGVGEFGMNEWNRLADISTSTRMYLAQNQIQSMNISSATKLARIWKHNIRYNRALRQGQSPDPRLPRNSWEYQDYQESNEPEPPLVAGAVELPAEDVGSQGSRPSFDEDRTPTQTYATPQIPNQARPPHRQGSEDDKFIVMAPTPTEYEAHHPYPTINVTPPPSRLSYAAPPSTIDFATRPHPPAGPPPIPPKTPLNGHVSLAGSTPSPGNRPPGVSGTMNRPPAGALPYPDTDGPPPVPNLARKPEFGKR